MKSELNILFLCSWYPNKTNTTLGNFIQKHAEAASLYNSITTLSVHAFEGNDFFVDVQKNKEVQEIRVYYPKPKFLFLAKTRQYFKWRKALDLGLSYLKTLNVRVDIVHVNVAFPMGLFMKNRFPGIPLLITEHASGLHPGPNSYSNLIIKRIVPFYRSAQIVLTVSSNLGERIYEISGVKCQVLPNVVDEHQFTVPEKVDGKIRFVHISTCYEEAKNVMGIIRAIKKLLEIRKDFEFHIISDGDTSSHNQFAKEIGVEHQIIFHGIQTTEEIAAFFKKTSALVLFSNFENFPCVIPEAWMSGVPVISTSVNGIPEFANSTNSLLIEKGNETQLVEAMQKIINGISFDKENLRKYALQTFSYETVGKQLNSIYFELKNGKK